MDMKKVLAYVQGINENLGGLIDALSENYETDGAIYRYLMILETTVSPP